MLSLKSCEDVVARSLTGRAVPHPGSAVKETLLEIISAGLRKTQFKFSKSRKTCQQLLTPPFMYLFSITIFLGGGGVGGGKCDKRGFPTGSNLYSLPSMKFRKRFASIYSLII